MPTQGFNIKSLMQNEFKLNVWDIGGKFHRRFLAVYLHHENFKYYFANILLECILFLTASSPKPNKLLRTKIDPTLLEKLF